MIYSDLYRKLPWMLIKKIAVLHINIQFLK